MTAGVPNAREPIPGGHDDRDDVLRDMREVAERVAITASLGAKRPRGTPQVESVPALAGAGHAGPGATTVGTSGAPSAAGSGGALSGLGPPSAARSGRAVLGGLLVFAAMFAALWAGQGSQDGFLRGAVSSDNAATPEGAAGQVTDRLDMGVLAAPASIQEPAASDGQLPVGDDARPAARGESLIVALLDDGDVVAASVDGAQVATAAAPVAVATAAPTVDSPRQTGTPPAAQPVIAPPDPPAAVDATAVVDAATQALVALGVQDVSVEFDSGVLLVRGTLPGGGGELDYATELDGIATAFSAVAGAEGVVARLVMSGEVAALDEAPEHLAGVARLTDVASAAESDALLSIAEARVIMQEYEAAVSEDRVRAPATEHRPAEAEATG